MTTVPPSRRQLTPLEPLIDSIENAAFLDAPGQKVGSTVRSTVSSQPLKDALSGTWLGHALHPLLTDVVIGSFVSATLLDLLGGDSAASERLIAIGLLAYGPTAVTGLNDWADAEPVDPAVRRAGVVHAGANAIAASLYAASLAARWRGARGRGRLLAVVGLATGGVAAYLGGYLSFTKGVGPAQTVYDSGPTDWTSAGDATDLLTGEPKRVVVDDTPVLLLRQGEEVYAIHDRCSHRGCSLSEGEIDATDIICSCHGSRFDYRDGSVKQGPATAPQPAFETRQREGRLEIRLVSG